MLTEQPLLIKHVLLDSYWIHVDVVVVGSDGGVSVVFIVSCRSDYAYSLPSSCIIVFFARFFTSRLRCWYDADDNDGWSFQHVCYLNSCIVLVRWSISLLYRSRSLLLVLRRASRQIVIGIPYLCLIHKTFYSAIAVSKRCSSIVLQWVRPLYRRCCTRTVR